MVNYWPTSWCRMGTRPSVDFCGCNHDQHMILWMQSWSAHDIVNAIVISTWYWHNRDQHMILWMQSWSAHDIDTTTISTWYWHKDHDQHMILTQSCSTWYWHKDCDHCPLTSSSGSLSPETCSGSNTRVWSGGILSLVSCFISVLVWADKEAKLSKTLGLVCVERRRRKRGVRRWEGRRKGYI